MKVVLWPGSLKTRIGLYDDLAIFDRALTADEVAAIYRLDGGVRALGK